MSRYDDVDLVAFFKRGTCRENLSAFLHEMKIPLSTIQGYAALIKKHIEEGNVEGFPEDFMDWIDKIATHADDLAKLREALYQSIRAERE